MAKKRTTKKPAVKKATKKVAKKKATKRMTKPPGTGPVIIDRSLPTESMIKELNQLSARRLELQRERDILKRREDRIKQDLMEHVTAHGGKKKRVSLGSFMLSLVPGRVSVSWKNEFIRVAGTEEAEKVSSEAKPKDKLEIKVA